VAAIELGLADRLQLQYAEVVPGNENASFAGSINPLLASVGADHDPGIGFALDSPLEGSGFELVWGFPVSRGFFPRLGI
jgi:hypothetical protein